MHPDAPAPARAEPDSRSEKCRTERRDWAASNGDLLEPAIVDVKVNEVSRQALGATQLHNNGAADVARVTYRVEGVDGVEFPPSDT